MEPLSLSLIAAAGGAVSSIVASIISKFLSKQKKSIHICLKNKNIEVSNVDVSVLKDAINKLEELKNAPENPNH
jgi:hypothetical protein